MHGNILVLNAGSSSIKFALFDGRLAEILSGAVTGIGGKSVLCIETSQQPVEAADHDAALAAIFTGLEASGVAVTTLRAAGHRVVHGGAKLTAPARLTAPVLAEIETCNRLAPLHNPHNLSAIHALARLAPDVAQFASFDTAFHQTNPDVATRYAIPDDWKETGIRRYGFHGISYQGMVGALDPLPRRLLGFHLGNGASACAILDGKSMATTMGYSPFEGLTMGSRAGALDPIAVLDLATAQGIEPIRRALNHRTGLVALSGGTGDMQELLGDHTPQARFAVDHFCYWAVRHGGSMIAAMGGLDAIAFTGGIGENAPEIRGRICKGLGWAGSAITNHVIPAREERTIANDVVAML